MIVTYDGWYAPIYFAEEDTDPGRHLPRSMIGSVVACIVIYLLVNAALFRILPLSQLAGSAIPGADAARAVLGAPGKQFILIISMVTVVSTINATLLITPRILYAMSRDGLLPRWGDLREHRRHLRRGTVSQHCRDHRLILSGGFETLIAIASVLYVLVCMSGFVALLVLRRSEPGLPRPYKVWCYPWSTLLVLAGSAAFFVAAALGDLKNSLFALILVVCTYPLYVLVVRNRARRVSLKVEELRDPAI